MDNKYLPMQDVSFVVNPPITNEKLNTLFFNSWDNHTTCDFEEQLKYCLFYVCAFNKNSLIGFIKIIWDGSKHGFLLDTTVHKDYQHQLIGTQLVRKAIEISKERGLEWLHVDYEPHLHKFYSDCGFIHTEAGLIKL